jgi:hypothetical protein
MDPYTRTLAFARDGMALVSRKLSRAIPECTFKWRGGETATLLYTRHLSSDAASTPLRRPIFIKTRWREWRRGAFGAL